MHKRTRQVATPAQTPPLAAPRRGAWFEGPDVVTALREYDGAFERELPRHGSFTLGSSRRCDLALPGRDLSAIHCMLERRGTRLRVHDQHSTNGTYFAGRRIDVIDLEPGDVFTPAPVSLFALNDEMRVHRPVIAEILGSGHATTPDRLLFDAVKTANHMLLTGEHGSDQDRLAHAIHAVSLRRLEQLVQVSAVPTDRAAQRALVDQAARSTLVLSLETGAPPLDPTFCSLVFSPSFHIRVIAIAASTSVARRALPHELVEQMQHVWVRPLALRVGEIPALLDRLLVERGASFRLADLRDANRDALCRLDWRDNLVGLRLAADRLTAISRVARWEQLDWRERAAAVGMAKSTLYDWFVTCGLSFPLVR